MQYELTLERYQGPLEKLLELIEGQKLEITQVSLAQVTGDFLAYIETLKASTSDSSTDPGLVADFLVVASKLILIKSKALLPTLPVTEEEEADMRDLEFRLKLFRELKVTQGFIKAGWSSLPVMVSREFLAAIEPVFYPPVSATPALFAETVGRIIGELERLLRPTVAVRNDMANLKTKIEEVLSRLTDQPERFGALHQGTRSEVIVLFLAILHLIKEQLIGVEQSGHFAEMTIVKRPTAA